MSKDIDAEALNALDVIMSLSTSKLPASKPTRIRTYHFYRKLGDDKLQEVVVTIDDAGPDVDQRYIAQARVGGRFADGKPSDSVGIAISNLNWDDLDQPPEKVRRRVEA